jgi:pimeloyl-ACP methyl ester carboxylesterase
MALSAVPPQKSTIGRPFKLAAAAVERWAPSLGAAAVERLWFTVPAVMPTVYADRNGGPAAIGEPFVVNVRGRRVRGQRWGDGRAVYLVHGWGGWGGQLVPLVQPLVEAGYRVITYDSLSHGESDPGAFGRRRSTLVEMADVLTAVADVHGQPAAVIAHSLGAPATALALRAGLKADRVVFIAPPANPAPYLSAFVRGLGFGRRVLTRTHALVERRVGVPFADLDVRGIASQVRTPPLLVVHDHDDREVPWSEGSAIADAWSEATLVSTTGLGHRRLLRDPVVLAEVASFVASDVGVLPSLDGAAYSS